MAQSTCACTQLLRFVTSNASGASHHNPHMRMHYNCYAEVLRQAMPQVRHVSQGLSTSRDASPSDDEGDGGDGGDGGGGFQDAAPRQPRPPRPGRPRRPPPAGPPRAPTMVRMRTPMSRVRTPISRVRPLSCELTFSWFASTVRLTSCQGGAGGGRASGARRKQDWVAAHTSTSALRASTSALSANFVRARV